MQSLLQRQTGYELLPCFSRRPVCAPSSNWSLSGSSIPNVLAQILREPLQIRPGRPHPIDELRDLGREFSLPLSNQDLADCRPPPRHVFAGMDQGFLPRLHSKSARQEITTDFLSAYVTSPGFTALLRAVDAIQLGRSALAPHRALCGVRRHSERS